MILSANRIARKYVGGLLQAPPAMVDAIYTWIMAIQASFYKQQYDKTLSNLENELANVQAVTTALSSLQATPTKWSLYTTVYEHSWVVGVSDKKLSAKEFQTLTPEKREELLKKVNLFMRHVNEGIEDRVASLTYSMKVTLADIDKLNTWILSGVQATEAKYWTKTFPMDLTGWRYGTEELKARAEALVKSKAEESLSELSSLEKTDFIQALVAQFEKQIQTGKGAWDRVNVVVTKPQANKSQGNWSPALQTLTINLPYYFDAASVAITLRHELQHVAQSYLSFALGKDPMAAIGLVGVPSKSVLTPQYTQNMNPSHPGYTATDPRIPGLTLKLKQMGVDPRTVDFHALDDIEFYSSLTDAAEIFTAQVKAAGSGSISYALKVFTAAIPHPYYGAKTQPSPDAEQAGGYRYLQFFKPYPFFQTLHKHAPSKWRKAVSEFVKAVT